MLALPLVDASCVEALSTGAADIPAAPAMPVSPTHQSLCLTATVEPKHY